MDLAYKTFVEKTPIKTGYAKANTRRAGNEINADYNYAKVLNDGRSYRDGQMRGSKQAPQGMEIPMIEEIRKYVFTKLGIDIHGHN